MVPLPNPNQRWRQVGGCPPKTGCFLSQNRGFLGAKRSWNPFKTAKGRETIATFHVQLDFLVAKSPLLPSNSMICLRNGKKKG